MTTPHRFHFAAHATDRLAVVWETTHVCQVRLVEVATLFLLPAVLIRDTAFAKICPVHFGS